MPLPDRVARQSAFHVGRIDISSKMALTGRHAVTMNANFM
jgi:hypothetical protein